MAEKRKTNKTIRDIARLSGFSRSTVSLVLNDSPRISEATRKKVMEVMGKVGYQPNVLARRLAERKSMMIGVIIPQTFHTLSDLYFSEAISGISDVLMNSGYKLLMQLAIPEFKVQKKYVNLFTEKYIDGLLIIGSLMDDEMVKVLRDLGHPIFLVNSTFEGVSSVIADNQSGASQAVDHLVRLGHKNIGIIKGLENVTSGADRSIGFAKAMHRHHLPIRDEWVAYGTFSEESGYVCMQQILGQRVHPTAMFIASDMMAIGATRAIRQHGLKVPEDIAIVGGDDIKLAAYVEPSLTTIRQDMYEIGALATSELISMIQKETSGTPVQKIVPTQLIVRKSCGFELGGRNFNR
jgi:LacI family transcriptional regulator